jgi:hypothetical protein
LSSKETSVSNPTLRFPQWQGEFEEALRETDHKMLFKRIEIAEALILSRREAVMRTSDADVEYQEIENALTKLGALKRDVLKFPS